MRKFTFWLVTLVLSLPMTSLFGQNRQLIPIEVQNAFKNETRSMNGQPGPKYWENHANYQIKATLLANQSSLKGSENVTYFNNSPDTLKTLVIRLYQNIYKKGGIRASGISPKDVTNGVKIFSLKINGEDVKMPSERMSYYFGTNNIIKLPKPLVPGDSLTMLVSWEFHIPDISHNRMGEFGKGRFLVAYWYPQIAVYDDISGWDMVNFNGITEFYNDFNNYDVTINTPAGYAVWATGHLNNPKEVYAKPLLKRLKEVSKSDKIISVINQQDWKENKVLRTNRANQWKYTAHYVTDFSFAATLKYNWDASSVLVDTATGRRVRVDAIYPDSSRSFKNAALYARESIEFLSYQMPGYPYPFEHMTSFDNGTMGGGMETPMMANDGDPADSVTAAEVIFHEISHSYFPFFMGTNERKYAWMDEGWATFFTGAFLNQYFPENHYAQRYAGVFSRTSGRQMELPMMIPSNSFDNWPNYSIQAYVRPYLAYKYLEDAMGVRAFKHAMLSYIKTWNGKHPIPFDFFNVFQHDYGKNLMWLIKPWFFGPGYADQGLGKVTQSNQIVVVNVGGLPMPVALKVEYTDGSVENILKPVSIWEDNIQRVIVQADKNKKIKEVILGNSKIPDVDESNNYMKL
ncbi:MAG: M1 family metallopeptidase [Bacteroidales bacterium]|nr:M1 family metallopeptidase [Bacteroidales bacterium]